MKTKTRHSRKPRRLIGVASSYVTFKEAEVERGGKGRGLSSKGSKSPIVSPSV